MLASAKRDPEASVRLDVVLLRGFEPSPMSGAPKRVLSKFDKIHAADGRAVLPAALSALLAQGCLPLGDHIPSTDFKVENRTIRAVTVQLAEDTGAPKAPPRSLPPGGTIRLQFAQGFSARYHRLDVVSGAATDTYTQGCDRDLTPDANSLEEGRNRVVVKPDGAGCQVAIEQNPIQDGR